MLQISIVLVLWLWDLLSSELSLGKYSLSWLSVGFSVSSAIILSSKGYGAQGWLCFYGSVTIVILSMVKRAH
jgi:hypothetical protein